MKLNYLLIVFLSFIYNFNINAQSFAPLMGHWKTGCIVLNTLENIKSKKFVAYIDNLEITQRSIQSSFTYFSDKSCTQVISVGSNIGPIEVQKLSNTQFKLRRKFIQNAPYVMFDKDDVKEKNKLNWCGIHEHEVAKFFEIMKTTCKDDENLYYQKFETVNVLSMNQISFGDVLYLRKKF